MPNADLDRNKKFVPKPVSKVEKIIAQISVESCEDRNSRSVNIMPPTHKRIEKRNSHAAIPAMVDSKKEVGLSIQICVNRRSRSHVKIRTASAIGKITYTIMLRNDDASV